MASFPRLTISGRPEIQFDDQQRAAVTSASRISLTEDQWMKVESACEEFVIWSKHERANPDAKEITEWRSGFEGQQHRSTKPLLEWSGNRDPKQWTLLFTDLYSSRESRSTNIAAGPFARCHLRDGQGQ